MNAFEEAWRVLKALEEQQGFIVGRQQPTMYGHIKGTGYEERPLDLDYDNELMGREGTIHPAILGMMRRRQNVRNFPSGMPFPDRRVAIEGEGARHGALEGHGPKSRHMKGLEETLAGFSREFHPYQREGPLSDLSQARRGSIFPYEDIDGNILPPLHGLSEEEIKNLFRKLGYNYDFMSYPSSHFQTHSMTN